MTENDAMHIARNPWGRSEQERREAALELADRVERWRRAYENMCDFARDSGLDITAKAPPPSED